MFNINPFNIHRANKEVLNEDNAALQKKLDKLYGKKKGKDEGYGSMVSPETKARVDAKVPAPKQDSKTAKLQKKIDGMKKVKKESVKSESVKYHIPEDIPANERTAFHGAAAAAAKQNKKSFEFGGKTHPVTMKKDLATKIADQKEGYGSMVSPETKARVDAKVPAPKQDPKTAKLQKKIDGMKKMKKESVKKESLSFREKLMSLYEGDRAAHYKGATAPEGMHDKMKSSKGAMDMVNVPKSVEADGMKAAKDTADNIKKSIPGRKMRSNDKKDGDNTIIPAATPVKDPSAKITNMESYGVSGNKVSNSLLAAIEEVTEKKHPHEEAMADHESQAREHSDNRHDNYKTSGKHHEAAKNAHNDAANHLEYGRTKQAKDSAKKAVYHAKQAKAAGGEDLVGETSRILKTHH